MTFLAFLLWLAMEHRWAFWGVLFLLGCSPFILSAVVMWAMVWVDARRVRPVSVDCERDG
jgi:hypothetical protein